MGTTSPEKPNPAATVLRSWQRLKDKPGGVWLFHQMLRRMIPYTGALGARVIELSPGKARVVLKDRRAVRNHLRSVHAIALANLGELATGLAATTAFTGNTRGILTGIAVEYHKKARGLLTAACEFQPPTKLQEPTACEALAEIADTAGDVVATVRATWLIEEIQV